MWCGVQVCSVEGLTRCVAPNILRPVRPPILLAPVNSMCPEVACAGAGRPSPTWAPRVQEPVESPSGLSAMSGRPATSCKISCGSQLAAPRAHCCKCPEPSA